LLACFTKVIVDTIIYRSASAAVCRLYFVWYLAFEKGGCLVTGMR